MLVRSLVCITGKPTCRWCKWAVSRLKNGISVITFIGIPSGLSFVFGTFFRLYNQVPSIFTESFMMRRRRRERRRRIMTIILLKWLPLNITCENQFWNVSRNGEATESPPPPLKQSLIYYLVSFFVAFVRICHPPYRLLCTKRRTRTALGRRGKMIPTKTFAAK